MVNIKEKLAQGYVQSRVIMEVVGKPKEHVEAAIKEYLEKLGKNPDLEVLKEDISEAKEVKDEKNPGLWGAFAEIEMLTKNFQILINFCFDYMPSSVEIIEPKELKLKDSQITSILTDLQGKLHQIDMIAKQLNNENIFLKKNTKALLRNNISILLLKSKLTADQLSKFVGLKKEELEKFLEIMIKENRVRKEEGKYSLVKQ